MANVIRCKICGNELEKNEAFRVLSPSRKYYYLCGGHNNDIQGYSTRNYHTKNEVKKHGFRYGIEFETGNRNNNINILYQYGFIPTSDGSLSSDGVEWKSPIFQSLNGLKKIFVSIDYINETEFQGNLIDRRCGTHLNISNLNWSDRDFRIAREQATAYFLPVKDFLQNHEEIQRKVFGRISASYCELTNNYQNRGWINFKSDNIIEVRLAKYKNADQYIKLMQLFTAILKAIKNNVINHYDDFSDNGQTTRKTRNTRKRKAKITANKIINLIQNLYNEVT